MKEIIDYVKEKSESSNILESEYNGNNILVIKNNNYTIEIIKMLDSRYLITHSGKDKKIISAKFKEYNELVNYIKEIL